MGNLKFLCPTTLELVDTGLKIDAAIYACELTCNVPLACRCGESHRSADARCGV
jgi:hypothetical protein